MEKRSFYFLLLFTFSPLALFLLSLCFFLHRSHHYFRLNVDPKKGDQIVRGSCLMPSGLGKQKILAVNTSKENHELALKTGADIVLKSEDFEDVELYSYVL